MKKIILNMDQKSRMNRNGLLIEVGKVYYYWNIGLGEIKTHHIISTDCVYATSSNGRVELDSLYLTKEEIKITNQ